MSRSLEREVKEAKKHLAKDYGSHEAWATLHDAQRRLAASKNEPWAEPLDLGVTWDSGAPRPHLLSNGHKAVLVCHASAVDPNWDGTYATVITPNDPEPSAMLEFTFTGCQSVQLGGPNDEVLHGHPLYSRGLDGYGPHVVHNSDWIASEEAINSVHDQHRGGWHQQLNHYFFVFHDEMFEALAEAVAVGSVRATMADCLASAARSILED
ncbi:MAG: hypothetical protein ACJ72E_11275 [Marmoricola sp.]